MTDNATELARPASRVRFIEIVGLGVILVATVTILLPALPASRENARSRYCRSNLRRLDLAAAQWREDKGPILHPLDWPNHLKPYCQDILGIDQTTEVSEFPPRPPYLTCPSRPDGPDMPTSQQIAHFVMIQDDNASGESLERFRDRPLKTTLNSGLSWQFGVTINEEEASRQYRNTKGPHKDGRFNESDSEGNPQLLPLP